MFYTLTLENETGQQIDLSRTANRFMFSKIEGLNPPAGTVSTSSYAGMDGSYLNNAFIESETWSFLLKCVALMWRNAGMSCTKWSSRHDTSKYTTPQKTSLCMPRVLWKPVKWRTLKC